MNVKLSLIPEDFLERITKNPNSTFNDFEIRLAVDALRVYAKEGTQSESKEARELLKKAKITNFIHKESYYNKTEDPKLRYWQTNIDLFLQNIIEMEEQAKPIWEKDKYHNKDKKPVTAEIMQHLTGKAPTMDCVKRVTQGQKGMQITNLILSIFAETQEIDYYSLKNFYNRPEVKEKKKKLLSLIENNYTDINLTRLDKHLNSEINSEKLSENPELGVLAQKEAYVEYIEKQFSNHKIPSLSFFWKLLRIANE